MDPPTLIKSRHSNNMDESVNSRYVIQSKNRTLDQLSVKQSMVIGFDNYYQWVTHQTSLIIWDGLSPKIKPTNLASPLCISAYAKITHCSSKMPPLPSATHEIVQPVSCRRSLPYFEATSIWMTLKGTLTILLTASPPFLDNFHWNWWPFVWVDSCSWTHKGLQCFWPK